MHVLKRLGAAMSLAALLAGSPQAGELVGLAPYVTESSGQQADASTGAYAQGFAAPAGAVLEAIRWWGFHGANSQGPAFDNLVVMLDGVAHAGLLGIVPVSAFLDEYTLDVPDVPLLASSLSIVNDSLDVEWFWQSAAAADGAPDARNVAFSLLGRIEVLNAPEPSSAALLLVALVAGWLVKGRRPRPAAGLLALCSAFAPAALAQPTSSVSQPLVQAATARLWLENQRHIPMCWHLLEKFATPAAAEDAKIFVVKTIREGWIDVLALTIGWVDCPASGDSRHVRVKLRSGDGGANGTTLQPGMATLSTADERLKPPPNDPPGLLMGFPADWGRSAQGQASFRALILHEFGHVLGFDHEQIRPDGAPGVACYSNALPNAIRLGPADPQSIMGWSYCREALGVLTAGDIAAAQSVYGIGAKAALRRRPEIGAILYQTL